jgi:hypothetical protein
VSDRDPNGQVPYVPGSRDSEIGWTPPPSSPQKHNETRIQAPDIDHDLGPNTPGQLGGEPSVGWAPQDE